MCPLSKSQIKFLNSLKLKKFRETSGQFIVEGDKIIRDLLKNRNTKLYQLIATPSWLSQNDNIPKEKVAEIIEAQPTDLERITSFETAPPVIAVMNISIKEPDFNQIGDAISIGLDTIQDPGNLGTIIRTADWFGIEHIICSLECADCYNPKVVQSSMGALANVSIYYADLEPALGNLIEKSVPVYGTFMNGIPIYEIPQASRGMIIFGNEARGISKEYEPYIQYRITIPSSNNSDTHVESLNVASAAAIACSWLVHK